MSEFSGKDECSSIEVITECAKTPSISKGSKKMATEWFISGNPEKYDIVNAFKELKRLDWKQSTNVAIGDIVYIYISKSYKSVKYKCKVNKVGLKKPDIDDKKFYLTGEFDGLDDNYMELELVEELQGNVFSRTLLERHGFSSPQGPVRIPPMCKEYIDLVQKLQHANELDPDKYDGSYELMRETIQSYANMGNLSSLDYKDLNLVYLMSVGTWKQKVPAKKKTIQDSNLPENEKQRLTDILDSIWSRAEKSEYGNQERNVASIGMFGTGFFTFQGKTDDVSPRNFIQMCIDIKDMTDDNDIFDRCQKTLDDKFHGMRAASASMILHCLKPMVFPVFNSNMGADSIFVYLGVDTESKTEINTYIKNARLVKAFRDANFKIKNYRIFDMAAWDIGKAKNKTNREALESMDPSNNDISSKETFDKNMILYGPPGTGKTYNTAIYAVAICKGESLESIKKMPYADVMDEYEKLKKAGRVAFTTFHQSYGYEEFIEGIKPIIDNEKNDIGYTIEDGVFKAFCDNARKKDVTLTGEGENRDLTNSKVWCILLDGTGVSELKKRCFTDNSIRIGWNELPDRIDDESQVENRTIYNILTDFQDEMQVGDIVVTQLTNHSIDGIGIITGDYGFDKSDSDYPRKRTVEWLSKDDEYEVLSINDSTKLPRKSVCVLHRVTADKILGLLKKDANITVDENAEPHVFIIDEINRGNISKIFGELITLIENTKREGEEEAATAILPYSKKPFSVPSNVYILGTMNTADRSIALMDTALRRRFQFEEMMPDANVLRKIGADKIKQAGAELDVAAMLEAINERIEYLFDREHTIGHAFFTGLKDEPTVEKLASIFKKSVIPLLQEYFYEDYRKIMLVLGDNRKLKDEQKFIIANEIKPNTIFRGDTSDIDIPDYAYEIQNKAFNNIESYMEIMN